MRIAARARVIVFVGQSGRCSSLGPLCLTIRYASADGLGDEDFDITGSVRTPHGEAPALAFRALNAVAFAPEPSDEADGVGYAFTDEPPSREECHEEADERATSGAWLPGDGLVGMPTGGGRGRVRELRRRP